MRPRIRTYGDPVSSYMYTAMFPGCIRLSIQNILGSLYKLHTFIYLGCIRCCTQTIQYLAYYPGYLVWCFLVILGVISRLYLVLFRKCDVNYPYFVQTCIQATYFQAIFGPCAAMYPGYMRPCIQAICGPVPRLYATSYPGYMRPCIQAICDLIPRLYAALYPGYM